MRGKFGAFKYSPKGTLLNPDEMEFQTNLMIDLVQNANEKDKVEVGKLTNRVASATSPTTNSGLQHDESHKNGDTRKSRSNDNPDTPKAKEVRLESSDDSRSEEEHLDLIDHFEKVSEKNPQKVMNLLMNYNTERSDIICRLREYGQQNQNARKPDFKIGTRKNGSRTHSYRIEKEQHRIET